MSETAYYPQHSPKSPEYAPYCHICGQPLICKNGHTNAHANGQFSRRASQPRSRFARVRLIPLEEPLGLDTGEFQAFTAARLARPEQIDVVEKIAEVAPPQTQSSASKSQTAAFKWYVAGVVAIGMALALMDSSIVSIALPLLQKAFNADSASISWVATGYFLAQATIIPIVGYLSDRLGSKMVYLTTLSLFTIASLLCALSPTKEVLIVSRVLQGLGGGALTPVAMAIVFRTFPPNERAKVTALISIPLVAAPAFGPPLGGYLSTAFDWRAIFFINLPIGIIALVLAKQILPGQAQSQAKGNWKRFDILGLLLSIVGFTALVFGLSVAGSTSWGDPIVLASLLIGVAVLVVLTVVELRIHDPVLDPRLFANYTFAISNSLLLVSTALFFGSLFLLPIFLENVQGNTALYTGNILIVQSLALGVGMTVSGTLYNRVGPRTLSLIGVLLMGGGTYMLTWIDIHTAWQALQIPLILRGCGLGLVLPSVQTLGNSVVSHKAMAKASSLISIIRQVASALGVAGLTTYMIQRTTGHATIGGQVTQGAMVAGLTDAFWLATILSIPCILLALVLGRDPAIEAYKKGKSDPTPKP